MTPTLTLKVTMTLTLTLTLTMTLTLTIQHCTGQLVQAHLKRTGNVVLSVCKRFAEPAIRVRGKVFY